jgi:hypothetical protein
MENPENSKEAKRLKNLNQDSSGKAFMMTMKWGLS